MIFKAGRCHRQSRFTGSDVIGHIRYTVMGHCAHEPLFAVSFSGYAPKLR